MTSLGFPDSIWECFATDNRLRRIFLPYLLRRAANIYPRLSGGVSRVNKTTVVKRGPSWQLQLEAEATRYAKLHTSIPVPAVYDLWTGANGKCYLAMEYKEGEVLQRKWHRLSDLEKTFILRHLASYVEQLRALPQPHPQGWIGSLSGNAFFDFAIFRGEALCGPFSNEHEFNDWRIAKYCSYAERHPPTQQEFRDLWAAMPENHRIMFTHGDLGRSNILVSGEGENIHITAILDWEQAGWRPEYWETFKFNYIAGRGDWRPLGRQHAVPGYDTELRQEGQLELLSGIH